MALIDDLQKQVNNILSGRGTVAQVAQVVGEPVRKGKGVLGGVARDVGVSAPIAAPSRPFCPFDNRDAQEAVALASRLMSIADRNGAKGGLDGLALAITELVKQLLTGPGLAQHALMLFLTHHPLARDQLTIEPLEQRQPGLVRPSPQVPARAAPTEDLLNFWREDPLLNEHHDHWHIAYPPDGRPNGSGPLIFADRQGELFVYMHEQMLARYDANRLSVGLPRVVPFDNYTAEIPEGYDPKGLQKAEPVKGGGVQWVKYTTRPPGATLTDLTGEFGKKRPGATLKRMDDFRKNLLDAADRGKYDIRGKTIDITAANFAASIEANSDSVDFNRDNKEDPNNYQIYGNLHNDGHVHFMYYDNKVDKNNNENPLEFGVIGDLATAVRDPAFWRWHKHIDTTVQAWQNTQKPHDFSDGPPVTVRKAASADGKAESMDIILCRKDGLPADLRAKLEAAELKATTELGKAAKLGAAANREAATREALALGAKLGAEAFGYSDDRDRNRWDTNFSSTTAPLSSGNTVTTTAELTTEMLQRRIKVPIEGGQKEETINYLSHDDFYYFLRLENRSDQPQEVTVRIFLAPETGVDDRTLWVDMDRFLYQLKGKERAVVFRPAELSSAIKKPAIRPENLGAGQQASENAWCDCGWPYTLLLPRGTEQGMEFRLLVVVTRGDDLHVDNNSTSEAINTSEECTSISYCGLKDKKYPDKRPMGYPFERPLDISSTIAKHDNWASRLIKIRCQNP